MKQGSNVWLPEGGVGGREIGGRWSKVGAPSPKISESWAGDTQHEDQADAAVRRI